MESGFFKVTPIRKRDNEKCGFVWVENPSEKTLDFLAFGLGERFYNGCEVVQADKNDIEFRNYLEEDLEKVEEDIQKLINLKKRLLDNLEKIKD